jgi:hypothetical protein
MSDRPTPETDAAFKNLYKPPYRVGFCGLAQLIWFVRRLERQRDEAREQLDPWMMLATSAEILRKKAEAQRDELLEAIANALHDPSISAKSKRPLADAFSSAREGKS